MPYCYFIKSIVKIINLITITYKQLSDTNRAFEVTKNYAHSVQLKNFHQKKSEYFCKTYNVL